MSMQFFMEDRERETESSEGASVEDLEPGQIFVCGEFQRSFQPEYGYFIKTAKPCERSRGLGGIYNGNSIRLLSGEGYNISGADRLISLVAKATNIESPLCRQFNDIVPGSVYCFRFNTDSLYMKTDKRVERGNGLLGGNCISLKDGIGWVELDNAVCQVLDLNVKVV